MKTRVQLTQSVDEGNGMEKTVNELRSQMLHHKKVDVEEELRKLEKKDKKRKRDLESDSEEERKLDPT